MLLVNGIEEVAVLGLEFDYLFVEFDGFVQIGEISQYLVMGYVELSDLLDMFILMSQVFRQGLLM